jgi:hypothetical protein
MGRPILDSQYDQPDRSGAAGPPPAPPLPHQQAWQAVEDLQPAPAFPPPEPELTLVRINAFTGEFTRVLAWAPHSDELVFAAASAIVAMRADGSAQRFLLGHTAHVCGLAFDAEGALLASVQEGRQAIVRVWDFRSGACAAILNGEAAQ